jgi:hypothetical protein
MLNVEVVVINSLMNVGHGWIYVVLSPGGAQNDVVSSDKLSLGI